MEKTIRKTSTEKYPAQARFVDILKKSVQPHISLVDEISDLLGISTDGAYRRLRCETALTFDEWVALSVHFNLPAPPLGSMTDDKAIFSFQSLGSSMDKFEQYLSRICNQLKVINQYPGHRLTFAAEQIPIFQYFNYKNLTAFKIFYWNYCILGAEELKGKKFEPQNLSDSLFELGQEIFEMYSKTNVREIWTEDTITGVLRQIEFFWESARFRSTDEALLVCSELKQLILDMESFAEVGRKFNNRFSAPENSYMLYNSEIMIGNNAVLIEMGDIRSSYIIYNTFNSMETRDRSFCDEMEGWVSNLLQKSILISGQGEKQRGRFVRKLTGDIERLEKIITG